MYGKVPGMDEVRAFWEQGEYKDGCLLWTGSLNNDGYGTINYDGRSWRATRLSLYLTTAENPGHKYACHHCDTPKCFNPMHLYWGSPQQNIEDKLLRTYANGKYNGLCMRGHDQKVHGKTILNGTSVTCALCNSNRDLAKKIAAGARLSKPTLLKIKEAGYEGKEEQMMVDYLKIEIDNSTKITEYSAQKGGVSIESSFNITMLIDKYKEVEEVEFKQRTIVYEAWIDVV
jgi:hypothetical protein